MPNATINFGLALYGIDPYGSEFAPFGVAGAVAYSPHLVQVRFTDIIDLTDPVYTTASNYVISPPLTVLSAFIESADSVVLFTDTQSFTLYTVTVGAARSYFNVPMFPPLNTATFTGAPVFPGYFAAATSSTRVRCVFSLAMQLNAALTNPGSYTVTDLNGNILPVLSVQPEQSGNPLSVVLTLGTPMVSTSWYQTVLDPAIIDTDGHSLEPLSIDFQFIQPALTTQVPINEFTGEVQGGPFGDPDGLVFFSPSLNVAASNSTIQVEEVDVCTTAYDQYHFPKPIDPEPFFLWSQGGPQTTLWEPGGVLFAGFPFLTEAKFDLEFTSTHLVEPMPPAFDGSCSIVLKTTFSPTTFISLLNDPAWILNGGLAGLFSVTNGLATVGTTVSQVGVVATGNHLEFTAQPGVTYTVLTVTPTQITLTAAYTGPTIATSLAFDTTVPPLFVCADNSVAPTPGSEQIIVLHQAMVGNSTMTVAEPNVVHWAVAAIHANSSLVTSHQIEAIDVKANSIMRVARPGLRLGANVHIVANSSMHIQGPPAPQNLPAAADIQAYAIVRAHVEQQWAAQTVIEGNATVFARAGAHRPITAAVAGNSAMTGTATVGPTATAHITAGSAVGASATLHHFASVHITGGSSVSATAT